MKKNITLFFQLILTQFCFGQNFVNGDFTNALNFDGTDDYVSLNNTANYLSGDNTYTIEFWMKADKLNQQNVPSAMFAINGNSSNSLYQNILVLTLGDNVGPNNGILSVNFNNGPTNSTGIQIGDNQCHHIAYVRNGTSANVYVDGVMVATAPVSSIPIDSTHYFSIGQEFDTYLTPSQFYNGDIDEFRIWNTARTQIQIQNNMNIQLTGNENGLVTYYDCNQGIANGNNTTEVSLTNSSNIFNLDGQFNNFALNGSFSNFIVKNCSSDSTNNVIENDPNYTAIKLYPNPATNYITLEYENNDFNNIIKIYDISGKLVTNFSYYNSSNKLSIDVNNLESGVYFLAIIDPMTNEVKQAKFVKH